MLPHAVPLNFATECMPIHFWYQWWLQSWPLLTDAFLLVYHHDTLATSCNPTERNLRGSEWAMELAKQQVCFFQFIFLHIFHSKFLLYVMCPVFNNTNTGTATSQDSVQAGNQSSYSSASLLPWHVTVQHTPKVWPLCRGVNVATGHCFFSVTGICNIVCVCVCVN